MPSARVVPLTTQLDLDAFVATSAKPASGGFVTLDTPPRVSPIEGRTLSDRDDLASEELYDPLLASKRYARETAL